MVKEHTFNTDLTVVHTRVQGCFMKLTMILMIINDDDDDDDDDD